MPLNAACRDISIEFAKTALDKIALGVVEDSIVSILTNIKDGFNQLDKVIGICN